MSSVEYYISLFLDPFKRSVYQGQGSGCPDHYHHSWRRLKHQENGILLWLLYQLSQATKVRKAGQVATTLGVRYSQSYSFTSGLAGQCLFGKQPFAAAHCAKNSSDFVIAVQCIAAGNALISIHKSCCNCSTRMIHKDSYSSCGKLTIFGLHAQHLPLVEIPAT